MTHSDYMKQQMKNTVHFLLRFILPVLVLLGALVLLTSCATLKKNPPYYHVENVRGALECEAMCEDVGVWMHQYNHYSDKQCIGRDLYGLSWQTFHVYKGPQGDTRKQLLEDAK